MLRIGVIPMPPVRNTAGLGDIPMQGERSSGAAHGELRAKSGCFNAFLKAVLRMRIAIMTGLLS